MPAAVVRGILISISVIAALGIAVYENPDVQQWLEDQRRKLATLLRNLGDDLDPQSRREAEAFAFGGRRDDVTRNETPEDVPAVVTGRSPPSTAIRRIPVQGAVDVQEREERQRLGREYLARRNQQMMEMQERRRTDSQTISSASASFDSLVDSDGKLRLSEESLLEGATKSECFDSTHNRQTTVGDESLVDPFLIDRSETPRPVVPPKIQLERLDPSPEPTILASSSQQHVDVPEPADIRIGEHRFRVPGSMPGEELSYDDQLALALAISKEESTSRAAHTSHVDKYANDLRLATEASLKDAQSRSLSTQSQAEEPLRSHNSDVSEEDLYNVTPNLTRARLAALDARHPSLIPRVDPIHDATSFHSAYEDAATPQEATHATGAKTPTEASSFAFESDADDAGSIMDAQIDSPARSHTMSASAELTEVDDQASDFISDDGIATPDSWTEVGSHDGDSDVMMHEATART